MNIEKRIKKQNSDDSKSVFNWVEDIFHIIKVFIVPYKALNSVKNVPEEIRKKGRFLGFLKVSLTLITIAFAFLLKVVNWSIEKRVVVLGILLFMLTKTQSLIERLMKNYIIVEEESYKKTFDGEVMATGSKILGMTAKKVYQYNESKGISEVMSNESLVNTIKNYLSELWQYQIQHKFDVAEMISICIMLFTVVITNDEIPNILFIPFVISFTIIALFLTVFRVKNRRDCYSEQKDLSTNQNIIMNDLLRIESIVPSDTQMRIEALKNVIRKNRKSQNKLNAKLNKAAVVNTFLECVFQILIIVFYCYQVKFENITLETITKITANLAVLMTALQHIANLSITFNNNADTISILEKEEKELKNIMRIYRKETERLKRAERVRRIVIDPFNIAFKKKRDNDTPFSLTSDEKIIINEGDICVFEGVSGSGKSTLMKLMSGQIEIGESKKIPKTSRSLMYDDKLCFGSLSIYEEFFSGREIHMKKAFSIIERLHLAQELKITEHNIEEWMKDNYYNSSMSHGQQQRMILAKILYHLDDTIDMVLLDEVSSGVDEKVVGEGMDVQQMLQYCVEYANSDRRRIVVLAIHQNIDECKRNLKEKGFIFKTFKFGDGKVRQI